MIYSCDFETTTDLNDCRVWAWCAIEINTETEYYGNSIESFIEWCKSSKKTLYFHNLKFDGHFILSYLLTNGFEYSKEKELKVHEFSTLINEMGQFYQLSFNIDGVLITIKDSLKLLNFSVDQIAKSFNMDIEKLTLDYKAKREKGHILTPEEKAYIKNDALIIARALKIMFDKGFKKLTIGSNALAFYKKQNKNVFKKYFPQIENDSFIRKSYKGGFTYCNPLIKNQIIKGGIVLDVNSLYPFVMHSPFIYPYGNGEYYEGKYEEDSNFPLYVQRLKVSFKIKPGYLPTIQIKNSMYYNATEYIENSEGMEELTLTSIDLELFLEHYEVIDIKYIDGYKFKAKAGFFDNYIDYWYEQKRKSKEENNKPQYLISKLMQNSLYGKFAAKPDGRSKIPYLDENGVVKFKFSEREERKKVYIPVGTFVTAYARDKTIRAAQNNFNRYLYSDTDSLHLSGYDLPELEIDDYKLGAWKLEGIFDEAKYLRSKLYMEHIRDPQDKAGTEKWKITGAGMNDKTKENVTIEHFNYGESFKGKLRPKHVKGGVVLVDTDFTIKY